MKKNAVRRSRWWAVTLAGVLAVVLPGCGSNDNGPNSQTVTDTQNVPVDLASFLAFSVTRNGTVDVDVNWNSSNNDIDIFATSSSCPDFDTLLGGGCSIIKSSDGSAKPERMSFGVSNGQAYKIWAWNLGPGDETITIRATIH